MNKKPAISIIIPAYNSHKYVSSVINRVVKVLKEEKLTFEVICICDGCTDNTQKVAEKTAAKYPGKVKVFSYPVNRGKGYAVRFGMAKASGEVVGFIDADNEIDPVSLLRLFSIMKKNKADIVVGSKRDPQSNIVYPWHRKLISDTYYYFVKFLFGLSVSDTQAGIKLFSKAVVKRITPRLSINGFSFDIEMLVWAKELGFTKIIDGPIIVDSSGPSESSLLFSYGIIGQSIKMFADTLRLFLKMKFLKYNQS